MLSGLKELQSSEEERWAEMGSERGPWERRRQLPNLGVESEKASETPSFFLPPPMHRRGRNQGRWPTGLWSLQDTETGSFSSMG